MKALPHLDPGSVRTHIISRCCINAPVNHFHRWEYFKRVSRGLYEVRPRYRKSNAAATEKPTNRRAVAERAPRYGSLPRAAPRDTVHAVALRSGEWYVAECLEIAVVTQGRTLDELVDNLRDAIDLHLDGEDAAALGLVPAPRVAVTYELASSSR